MTRSHVPLALASMVGNDKFLLVTQDIWNEDTRAIQYINRSTPYASHNRSLQHVRDEVRELLQLLLARAVSHPLVRLKAHRRHPELFRHVLVRSYAVLVLQHLVRGSVREEHR